MMRELAFTCRAFLAGHIPPGRLVKDLGFPVIMMRAGGECMKKSSRFTGLVLTLLGAMVLLNNLGKPRVEALHGSDVRGLVASGICLGIGFAGLMGRLSFGTSRVRGGDRS
jgi:hypothetical protein